MAALGFPGASSSEKKNPPAPYTLSQTAETHGIATGVASGVPPAPGSARGDTQAALGSARDGGIFNTPRAGPGNGGRGSHARLGGEVREEFRIAKLQRQTAEEQVAIYENRINLLQQRRARALRMLDQTHRREEKRNLLREKAEEEAVERFRHREENRASFEQTLFEHRSMVENTRARAQLRRVERQRQNREKVLKVQQEKHIWRELRGAQREQEAEQARNNRESIMATERAAHGNKEQARLDRIEQNRLRMRRTTENNLAKVNEDVRLIGQYAEIERNLIDFVQSVEDRNEQREAELHERICTAPSTRVDRMACALMASRSQYGRPQTDGGPGFADGRGYATLGSWSEAMRSV